MVLTIRVITIRLEDSCRPANNFDEKWIALQHWFNPRALRSLRRISTSCPATTINILRCNYSDQDSVWFIRLHASASEKLLFGKFTWQISLIVRIRIHRRVCVYVGVSVNFVRYHVVRKAEIITYTKSNIRNGIELFPFFFSSRLILNFKVKRLKQLFMSLTNSTNQITNIFSIRWCTSSYFH